MAGQAAINISENVAVVVPHRQFVFTMPDDLTAEPFLKLWEHKIFALLLAEGRITEKVVEQMRTWKGYSRDFGALRLQR